MSENLPQTGTPCHVYLPNVSSPHMPRAGVVMNNSKHPEAIRGAIDLLLFYDARLDVADRGTAPVATFHNIPWSDPVDHVTYAGRMFACPIPTVPVRTLGDVSAALTAKKTPGNPAPSERKA